MQGPYNLRNGDFTTYKNPPPYSEKRIGVDENL